MNTPQKSLRAKLLLSLLIPNIALWIVAGFGCYYIGGILTRESYDQGLGDSLRTILSKLRSHNHAVALDLTPDALQALAFDSDDIWYFSVRGADSRVIAGNENLPRYFPTERDIEYFYSEMNHEAVRGAARHVPVDLGNGKSEDVLVQVAETMHGRHKTIRSVIRLSSILLAVLLILSSFATWLAMRIVLAPLERLRNAVAERDPGNLAALSNPSVYREIQPLVAAINLLLGRLRRELHGQRQFMGDVAHTLRTGLAGVKLHAELGARAARDENSRRSFQRIMQGIVGLSRIANQLLALAKAERNSRELETHLPLDLAAVAQNVVKDFQSRAAQKKIQLNYESTSTDVTILGSAVSLTVLLENLIDNSLQYTPAGGQIDVRVQERHEGVVLVVEDTGCGIAPEERTKVFAPFYRAPGISGEGSGLGLSIVKRIAERHRVQIAVGAGPQEKGTVIALTFPVAARVAQAA